MSVAANSQLAPSYFDTTFRVCDHICGFYRDRDEFVHLVFNYVAHGLRSGQRCCIVVDLAEPREFVRELEHHGLPCGEYMVRKLLHVYRTDEFYVPGGCFDPDATLARIEAEMIRAEEDGLPMLRIMGQMTWVHRLSIGIRPLLEYEARLNDLMPRHRQMTFCLYDVGACSGATVLHLLRTHPKILINGAVVSNPYYLPPDTYLQSLTAEG